jgi:C4-dicarboxylate transporter, DctM subunit
MNELAITLGTVAGIGLLLCGLEVVFALGAGSMLMLWMIKGETSLKALGFIVWGGLNSPTLSALPLFVLMAEFMLRSGMSNRFYGGMSHVVNRLPGRLLQTNIAGSAVFAAICGSSVATAAAIGSVALPRQKADGYDIAMSCGSVAAGGVLGILIPPSIVMILYGTFAEASVVKLFAAGIVPGIALTLIFMLYIGLRNLLTPSIAPAPSKKDVQLLKGLVDIAPVAGLILVVLGSIYAGFATPTEAAAIGAFAAGLLSFIVCRPAPRAMWEAVVNAVVVSAALLWIALSAFIFSYAVETTGLARAFADYVVGLDLGKYTFLFWLMFFYLILGCVVDSIAMILLTVPLLLPILAAYDIDLIWFGVVLVVAVELGQITPPVGINLFVVDSISGAGIGTVVRGTAPYVLLILVFLILLTLAPGMATWLPEVM